MCCGRNELNGEDTFGRVSGAPPTLFASSVSFYSLFCFFIFLPFVCCFSSAYSRFLLSWCLPFPPFWLLISFFFPGHLCCVLDLLRHTPFAHENSRIEEWAVSRAAEGDASMGRDCLRVLCDASTLLSTNVLCYRRKLKLHMENLASGGAQQYSGLCWLVRLLPCCFCSQNRLQVPEAGSSRCPWRGGRPMLVRLPVELILASREHRPVLQHGTCAVG